VSVLQSPARTRADWAVTPPRVSLRRVFGVCAVALAAEISLMRLLGRSWQETLLPGYVILLIAFGAVFVLAAVTVAGFTAGAAAAGLITLGVVGLLPVLGGAAALAVLCGFSTGWTRVEAWQAARSVALTAGQEAAVARVPLPITGRHRPEGPGRRIAFRGDRAMAAFLVLAFLPTMASFSLWFAAWVASR
jgi:hypothetical protein